jgi:hypothetical protein
MIDVLVIYALGGVVFGTIFASHERVFFTYKGKPVRPERLWAGLAAGLVWPIVAVKLLFRPLPRG